MTNVLLVDDGNDIRLMMRLRLKRRGWEVEEAPSGEEALEKCRAGSYDVVILDDQMPGIHGSEVARILRDEGFKTPIILYSAYLSPTLLDQAKASGVRAVSKENLVGLFEMLDEVMATN